VFGATALEERGVVFKGSVMAFGDLMSSISMVGATFWELANRLGMTFAH
jgi:hypothetical protein